MQNKVNLKGIICWIFLIVVTLANASPKQIIVKFKPNTINISVGQKEAKLKDINKDKIQLINYFEKLSINVEFEKLRPKAKPADTLYVNKKGEVKKLNDWSQVFKVKIPNSDRNIMDIIDDLVKFEDVEYAEPPIQVKSQHTPDDLDGEGYQWSLHKINVEDAWDITTGSTSITIAIIEDYGVDGSHTDIEDKLTIQNQGSIGSHGLMVAGIAGCETNNSTGFASLGYNTMLIPKFAYANLVTTILDAADPSEDDADIINCSFKTVQHNEDKTEYWSYDYSPVEDAIEDVIAWGKIIVASAGNPPDVGNGDQDEVPYTCWPSAYSGVIGVSATNSSDAFPSGYNYGSFVDLSAPGTYIRVLDLNDDYTIESGTSFSAPFVSALAALILSNDNSLTPTQVQEAMELSAEDLGATGRDNYFGYGRIDAYEAVKNLYVPDVYTTIESALDNAKSGQTVYVNSGTLTGNTTVSDGVTLTITSGVTVYLNGHYIKCTGSGEIIRNSGSQFSPKDIQIISESTIKGQYPSINSAITNASSGQIVYSATDTYTENINMKYGVKLKGDYGFKPTIDGTITFSNDDYAGIENLKVKNKITICNSDNVLVDDIESDHSNCYIESVSSESEINYYYNYQYQSSKAFYGHDGGYSDFYTGSFRY